MAHQFQKVPTPPLYIRESSRNRWSRLNLLDLDIREKFSLRAFVLLEYRGGRIGRVIYSDNDSTNPSQTL